MQFLFFSTKLHRKLWRRWNYMRYYIFKVLDKLNMYTLSSLGSSSSEILFGSPAVYKRKPSSSYFNCLLTCSYSESEQLTADTSTVIHSPVPPYEMTIRILVSCIMLHLMAWILIPHFLALEVSFVLKIYRVFCAITLAIADIIIRERWRIYVFLDVIDTTGKGTQNSTQWYTRPNRSFCCLPQKNYPKESFAP